MSRSHFGLLALSFVMALGGCKSAQGRYATYAARCNTTKAVDDCYRQGYYAVRTQRMEEGKDLLQRACHQGSEAACREFTAHFPEDHLQKVGSDRLGTTEPLTAPEAEQLVSRNIHWKIDSEPRGAIINWRINSSTQEVTSTLSTYLDRTPYEGVRRFDVKGLTNNNMKYVNVVLEIEAKGYYPQRKEFQLSAIIQQGELSSFFGLEKVRD